MKKNTYINNINKIIILVTALFLFSCDGKRVLKDPYSKKTVEGDLERIQAIANLDSSEYQSLTDYMLKIGLIEPDLKHINQSYEELLKLAKEDKKKMDKVAEHNKKMKATGSQFYNDHSDVLHQALIMMPEKSEITRDWSNSNLNAIKYKMVFVNPGMKAIKAFKGEFTFMDQFDTELKTISFTYNKKILPKDTAINIAFIELLSQNGNVQYVSEDFKDLKVIWQPVKILFTDGSTVSKE
jgi:hypothetical protein